MSRRLVSVDPDAGYALPAPVQAAVTSTMTPTIDARSTTKAQAASSARGRVGITTEMKTTTGGIIYTVTKVRTGGAYIPGLVGKSYALDYEKNNTTGANFKPIREDLDAAQRRTGAALVANADGWRTSGNTNEIRGVQIKDSQVFHEFEDIATSPVGVDALGVKADGTFKGYSMRRGDTAASMLADGVVHSFAFGPLLTENGNQVNLSGTPAWGNFLTEISARQILGQSSTGDIILITTEGITNTSGLNAVEAAALAASEGCYVSILLDGGGSAQSIVEGVYSMPSTDAGRKRPVPAFLTINSPLATRGSDTAWYTVPYASGYVQNTGPLQVRATGKLVELRGDVKLSSGSFDNTSRVVATLPARFWFTGATKAFVGMGDSLNLRKVAIDSSGNIQVVGSTTNTPTYMSFDMVKYSTD